MSGGDSVTPVSGSFTFTYFVGAGTGGTDLGSAPPVGVGAYTVVATFTSADPDYRDKRVALATPRARWSSRTDCSIRRTVPLLSGMSAMIASIPLEPDGPRVWGQQRTQCFKLWRARRTHPVRRGSDQGWSTGSRSVVLLQNMLPASLQECSGAARFGLIDRSVERLPCARRSDRPPCVSDRRRKIMVAVSIAQTKDRSLSQVGNTKFSRRPQ